MVLAALACGAVLGLAADEEEVEVEVPASPIPDAIGDEEDSNYFVMDCDKACSMGKCRFTGCDGNAERRRQEATDHEEQEDHKKTRKRKQQPRGIPVSCNGGVCVFTDCIDPTCDGGGCTFVRCTRPHCKGGACKFYDTRTVLEDGYCPGGGCTVEGVPVRSRMKDSLVY